MAPPKDVNWEAIEREYRAGQLSVLEIGRQFGVSHTAVNKRAKKYGWTRDLSARVRAQVSARLVSKPVSTLTAETEREAIDLAATRGVQIVREHLASIGHGKKGVDRLITELQESTKNRIEIEQAIKDETADDKNHQRRAMMQRAVGLPSRAGAAVDLSNALKTLVGLERQALNLDKEPPAPANTVNIFNGPRLDLSQASPETIAELRQAALEAIRRDDPKLLEGTPYAVLAMGRRKN